MPKRIAATAMLLLCAGLLCAQSTTPTFADASFETPSVGGCSNFQYAPAGTAWTFTASAGVTATGCPHLFSAPTSPTGGGTQAAFIQAGSNSQIPNSPATASISQIVDGFVAGHAYTITFFAAGRLHFGCSDNCGELNLSVFVGETDVLDVINPPTNIFQSYTTTSFMATGSVLITFSGTTSQEDQTSFIDLLSIQDLGPAQQPSISAGGIVSASAFGEFASVSPGSWIEIYGSNLAADTRSWQGSDFNGINAPTSLDGTSVTIGGQMAFVDYISPGQVNALIPSNVATGTQQLTLTAPGGTAAAVNITVNPVEPGLLAPPNFNIGDTQYVVAQFADGRLLLRRVTFSNYRTAITFLYSSRPASLPFGA